MGLKPQFCGDVIPDHFPTSIGFFFPRLSGKIRSLQPQVVDGNNGFDGAKVQLWKCAGDQYAKTWSPWTQEAWDDEWRWMAMNGSAKPKKRGVFGMERLATCLLKQRFGCFFWLSDVFLTLVRVFVSWNPCFSDLMVKICATRWEKTRCSAVRFFTQKVRQLWGKWPSKKPGKIWFCPKIIPSRSLQESNMGVLTEKVIYKWGIFHWNVWLPEDTRTSSSGCV